MREELESNSLFILNTEDEKIFINIIKERKSDKAHQMCMNF
jgi:hypothetical protein